MRRALLLVAALLVVGCFPGQRVDGNGITTAVQYVHDDARGVSCWVYASSGGISCLPDSQVKR